MSTDETRPILCGKCRIQLKGRTELDGRKIVVCATCGNQDTLENAAREAAEYEMDKMVRNAFGGLNNLPGMTVKCPSERQYRFIFGH